MAANCHTSVYKQTNRPAEGGTPGAETAQPRHRVHTPLGFASPRPSLDETANNWTRQGDRDFFGIGQITLDMLTRSLHKKRPEARRLVGMEPNVYIHPAMGFNVAEYIGLISGHFE